MSGSAKKARVKTSQNFIPVIEKGPEVYRDVEWHSLNDDEAKAVEKDGSLAWQVLTNSQMQTLMSLSIEELEIRLAEMMGLRDHDTVLREAALLDFYVSAFWWGKEQGWNEQQISGLITVHYQLIDNLRTQHLTLEENLSALKKMLVGIGTKEDKNGGLDFLDVNMATSLVEFMSSTFFQHYRLYEFLCSGERAEEVISTDLEVELLPPASLPHPPPLDEGLPEDLYQHHVAPPPKESPDAPVISEEALDSISKETTDIDGSKQENAGGGDKVADILVGVTSEDIKKIFDSVSKELFSSVQKDVAEELKDRESEIISRINKIHRISDT